MRTVFGHANFTSRFAVAENMGGVDRTVENGSLVCGQNCILWAKLALGEPFGPTNFSVEDRATKGTVVFAVASWCSWCPLNMRKLAKRAGGSRLLPLPAAACPQLQACPTLHWHNSLNT